MKVFYLMILCHYRKNAAAWVLYNQNQTVKLPLCLYSLFKEILAVEISRSSETVCSSILPFTYPQWWLEDLRKILIVTDAYILEV